MVRTPVGLDHGSVMGSWVCSSTVGPGSLLKRLSCAGYPAFICRLSTALAAAFLTCPFFFLPLLFEYPLEISSLSLELVGISWVAPFLDTDTTVYVPAVTQSLLCPEWGWEMTQMQVSTD